jgi:hypothetical protein
MDKQITTNIAGPTFDQMEVTQHYVEFLSPGTFESESTIEKCSSWDIDAAVARSRSILQAYNAKPYAFRFTTRGRKDGELDSKEIAHSRLYWLGGKVETAEEILARNHPDESALRLNIKIKQIKRIITNYNSWRFTAALGDEDVVLDYSA